MCEHHAPLSSTRKQVLIVEDHKETAEMVKIILEDEGYQVRWVERAHDALEILATCDTLGTDSAQSRPDVVLLDLTMPDMDPIEMVRQMQAANTAMPPVIVVSAKPTYLVEAAAHLIGASGIVQKPFTIHMLLAAIEIALAPCREC